MGANMSFVPAIYDAIGSFARNFHIGFDPDYEVIKNTRLTSNETPDDQIVWLVV